MSKSFKFEHEDFLDASSVVFNREQLDVVLQKTPKTALGNTAITYMQLTYNNGWKLYLKAITDGIEKEFLADLTEF